MAVTRWRAEADAGGPRRRSSSCATWPRAAQWSAARAAHAARTPERHRAVFCEHHAAFTHQRAAPDHHDRSRRLGRGRCRGAARDPDQHRPHGARDRRDLLCRTGAGPAGGRPGASGLFQDVRGDRLPARTGRHHRHAPAPLAARPRGLGRPYRGGRRRSRPRPIQIETDRARFIGRGRSLAHAAMADGAAVGHDRAPCWTRSSRSAAASASRPAAWRG